MPLLTLRCAHCGKPALFAFNRTPIMRSVVFACEAHLAPLMSQRAIEDGEVFHVKRLDPWAPFTEKRTDGWPLCPSCGGDDLCSDYSPYDDAGNQVRSVEHDAYVKAGVHCLTCDWSNYKR